MKVRITLTLDINEDSWTTEYGMKGASHIREDVRQWVHTQVVDELDDRGLLKQRLPW